MNKIGLAMALTVSVILAAPVAARAAGAHEDLSCKGCHAVHTARGRFIFAVAPNKTLKSPRDKKPYGGITALCLGCHAEEKNGGQGIIPISGHSSHPFGSDPDPKVARVPAGLLRGGALSCVSCHDPHPSNPNYKYLRVATDGGEDMQVFCAVCHPAKADRSTAARAAGTAVFSSMDERRAPARAGAKGKK